jgi:4-aminobutyrate aminotransferase/(S)-3-amino-2-methylpropionate transaminase
MLRDKLPKIVSKELPGEKSKKIIELRENSVPSAIPCGTPYVIDRAEGAMIQDLDGNIIMDWVAGIGVLNIGHSNPEIIETVKKQTERYFHPQINTIHYSEYIELADKLNNITPGAHKKRTGFFNSGSEAVDNAIKIARKFTKRSEIIAFSGGFHGRTYMAMTLTSGQLFKAAFGPLAPGVHRGEFPNVYRAPENIQEENIIKYYIDKLKYMFVDYVKPETIAAIILEPLQGEAGFIEPPIEYIKELRNLCDQYGILLIADEIQTGFCRTGKMFATERWEEVGVYPDILITAKSLAGGIPLSAVTAKEEIMESLLPGEIGGTYGGNPLACAAGLKIIEIMERDNYAEKALKIGEKCNKKFEELYEKYDCIGTYRVRGAMASIEFVKDRKTKEPDSDMVKKVMTYCKYKGLLLKNAGSYNQIVRLLMPLITNDEQIEFGFNLLDEAIKESIN